MAKKGFKFELDQISKDEKKWLEDRIKQIKQILAEQNQAGSQGVGGGEGKAAAHNGPTNPGGKFNQGENRPGPEVLIIIEKKTGNKSETIETPKPENGAKPNDKISRLLGDVERESEDTTRVLTKLFGGVGSAIGDGFSDGVFRVEDALGGLKNFAKGVLGSISNDLNRSLSQFASKGLTQTILPAIGNFIFGGIGVPAKAAGGGPVFAGVPTLVGERGRELFIPQSNGSIVSNKNMGSVGGSTINMDLRGSNGSQEIFQTVQKAIRAAAPAIINQAVVTVKDGRQRDPSFFSR